MAEDDQPLTPTVERKKTRYSDRAPIEDKARRDSAKAAKVKQQAALHASAPISTEEKAKQQAQAAPLGLGGDTATKKQPTKVKGAPKERLQEKAPAPPAAKPEATPIPPKSVRENGEPVVNPAPPVPAVTMPGDAQPSTPASPAAAAK
jgi:peptidyl-prolyl cis-trans isomerase SurA